MNRGCGYDLNPSGKDMSVTIAGVTLKNPILTASGTFGFGREYGEFYSLSELGGVCVKGLYMNERPGNPPPRVAETPSGMLNSIGLQGPGVERFIAHELPNLRKYDTRIVVNVSGSTLEEYCRAAERLSDCDVDMIEMNISCPNVKEGGVAFGTSVPTVYAVTNAVRRVCGKPLIVKLSPNVTDITEIARAAEEGGADALSLINTLLGMKIDVHTRRPVLYNNVGGLSGPAVKPVAVRMVWQVRKAVRLPIIGMGGVMTGEDAAEFLLAGADAVAVGTASFVDPMAPVRIRDELAAYMDRHSIARVSELSGAVLPNG